MAYNQVLIAFGANLGDPKNTLYSAIDLLNNVLFNIQVSSFYQTQPHYDKPDAVKPVNDAPNYLNAVFTAQTKLSPNELLERLLAVEDQLGRVRTGIPCESRSIDLDLIFYNNLVIKSDSLVIPHPRMHTRNFVLIPATEIVPDWNHPLLNCSVQQLAESCNDNLFIRKI